MQRSRRALLQQRALEKTIIGQSRLYKVSLSLVFLLWGLVFLLSLWISHGDGYGGESPFEFLLCFYYCGKLFSIYTNQFDVSFSYNIVLFYMFLSSYATSKL